MGSSRPAFWDGQSSRRRKISRLSELKRKTIASKRGGLFIFGKDDYEIMDCVPSLWLDMDHSIYRALFGASSAHSFWERWARLKFQNQYQLGIAVVRSRIQARLNLELPNLYFLIASPFEKIGSGSFVAQTVAIGVSLDLASFGHFLNEVATCSCLIDIAGISKCPLIKSRKGVCYDIESLLGVPALGAGKNGSCQPQLGAPAEAAWQSGSRKL